MKTLKKSIRKKNQTVKGKSFMKEFQRCFNLRKVINLNHHIKKKHSLDTGCSKHTFTMWYSLFLS